MRRRAGRPPELAGMRGGTVPVALPQQGVMVATCDSHGLLSAFSSQWQRVSAEQQGGGGGGGDYSRRTSAYPPHSRPRPHCSAVQAAS